MNSVLIHSFVIFISQLGSDWLEREGGILVGCDHSLFNIKI